MERTKQPELQINSIQVLAQLAARNLLATRLGMQYNDARDLYRALGYPEDGKLKYEDFYGRYKRHDIAKAIISRPVRSTWKGELELVETNKAEDTSFEIAWKELNTKLTLKKRFSQVDKLSGIGKYAILILGFNDVPNDDSWKFPVKKKSNLKLEYVRAFSEKNAQMTDFETNPKNSRYGDPLYYTLSVKASETGGERSVKVHYSRVIHIVQDSLESDYEGFPLLESVYNRLLDIEKIVGGDGEMFWRGARPGYSGKLDKDVQMPADGEEAFMKQLDEYEHNLRRFLFAEGVDIKELAQQLADPSKHFDTQIQCISAATGIPKRILTGSERGELSSAQDAQEMKTYIQERREEHAEVNIIRPFADKMIELGILPEPSTGSYKVKWSDLFAMSSVERTEVGKNRALALRDYANSPMIQDTFPPEAFMEFLLGLSDDEIELVKEMAKNSVLKESALPDETVSQDIQPPVQVPRVRQRIVRTR